MYGERFALMKQLLIHQHQFALCCFEVIHYVNKSSLLSNTGTPRGTNRSSALARFIFKEHMEPIIKVFTTDKADELHILASVRNNFILERVASMDESTKPPVITRDEIPRYFMCEGPKCSVYVRAFIGLHGCITDTYLVFDESGIINYREHTYVSESITKLFGGYREITKVGFLKGIHLLSSQVNHDLD